jgi:hypothetical protein
LKRAALPAALALVLAPVLAQADPSPAPTLLPVPTASEQPFVQKAAKDLEARYPTANDAVAAGYTRFTNEDKTGAISYENGHWTSTDADHPSQLWYDVNGRLLGADYSVPLSDTRPNLFGIDPSRWITFRAHVHYGLVGPGGTTTYGGTGGAKFKAAGGNVAAPTADQLVAAGIAKSASDVRFVFPFPAIWDLEVWILPNPSGAFAESNPNVHPVNPPKEMD